MIKHIVMWNLKCSDSEKSEVATKIKNQLENLKGEIEEIIDISVGENINFKDKDARDLCLIVHTKSMESLSAYANHEKHLAVLKVIKPYLENRTVIDIEI